MEKGKITLTIIKPHAVVAGNTGKILAMIEESGFTIKSLKMLELTNEKAASFYAQHYGAPYYERLIACMTSGPVVVAILEKDNAVSDYRKLIGATDPAKAAEGTIRERFGLGQPENAVHGSDCDDNALIESNFFFSFVELPESARKS